MKVLILCNDFYPLNSIGAERPYSWFKYFKKYDIEPIVVTKNWIGNIANSSDVISNIHSSYSKENLPEGTIYRVPHSIILPEKMLLTYGISKFIFLRKIITFIYKILSFHCSFFDQHSLIFKQADTILSKTSVDCIITTGEPFILFKYGYALSRKYSIPWIADYRDGWYCNHVTSLHSGFLHSIIRKNEWYCEKKYVKQAKTIVTVDTYLAQKLQQLHSKKTIVSYNGFWEMYENTNDKNPSNQLVLTHTGTVTPGQRVEFLLESVKELIEQRKISPNDIVIKFVGLDYFPQQKKRIFEYSQMLQNSLYSTERVSQQEAIRLNLESDFLVTFTEENNTSIYAKTYTYMACKKHILVVPDDNGLLSNLITQYSLGTVFSTKEQLQEFIIQKIADKKKGILQSNNSDIESIMKFSRENQAKELTQELQNIFS